MTVRHSMFYIKVGYINTEMGFDQSLFGILLIPVTASFGMFSFWNNRKINILDKKLIKYCIYFSLPLIFAFFNTQLSDIFLYRIDDGSRRPTFLILVPIVVAIVYSQLKINDLLNFFISLLIYLLFMNIFIVHYFFLFNLFRLSQRNKLFSYFQNNLLYSMVGYLLIAYVIFIFKINRINLILELIFSFFYLSSIYNFAIIFSEKYNKFSNILNSIGRLSIFYFYLFQALLFTFFLDLNIFFNNCFLIIYFFMIAMIFTLFFSKFI